MRMTRAGIIAFSCMIVLAALLIAWRLRPAPQLDGATCTGLLGRPLRVGIVLWPGYVGGILANDGFEANRASIFYQRHKLCVEFLPMDDGPVRDRMFKLGGKDGLDIVWSTVDSWSYQLPANKLKARAIMQVDWSHGGDAVVADGSIRSLAGLAHKRIALTEHTPSRWLLEQLLDRSGLDENRRSEIIANLVPEKASGPVVKDFAMRKVDAAVLWEPDVTEALKARTDSKVLFDTNRPETKKQIADIMVAREHFIREHPDVIEAFISGWMDGTETARRSCARVVNLLMSKADKDHPQSRDATEESLGKVRWAGLLDNDEMFALDGSARPARFDEIFVDASKVWMKHRDISFAMDPAAAKDDRFIRRIFHRNFPDGLRLPSGAEMELGAGSCGPLIGRTMTALVRIGSSR